MKIPIILIFVSSCAHSPSYKEAWDACQKERSELIEYCAGLYNTHVELLDACSDMKNGAAY